VATSYMCCSNCHFLTLDTCVVHPTTHQNANDTSCMQSWCQHTPLTVATLRAVHPTIIVGHVHLCALLCVGSFLPPGAWLQALDRLATKLWLYFSL
jgi:hypothetical protein